jgi:hypothetical protein
LKLGDKVKATDPTSGQTRSEPVVSTIVGQGTKHLVDIAVTTTIPQGASQTAHLIATDGHPFYLPSERHWVRATDLAVEDVLRPLQSGTRSRVTSIGRYDVTARVHNLTIGTLHTYYVLAGETAVLVHNAGGMAGCSDAAYQGVLHIRDEAEKELKSGKPNDHKFDMSDDDLADYLDGFAGTSDGNPLRGGGSGWHDPERGVTIIQRSPHSMTSFKETAKKFSDRTE